MIGNELNLKEYSFPKESFISGWFIPEHICDGVLQHFYNNKHLSFKGRVGDYESPGGSRVQSDYKDSLDLNILWNAEEGYLKAYTVYVNACLHNYINNYKFVNQNFHFSLNNYNLQYYPIGGGFKKWHFERTTPSGLSGTRVLVFMTYLNDVEDGGTEFYYQGVKTPAKKGLTIIWPSDFTHTHRGIISHTKEKYIATGWFNYDEDL